MTGAGRGSLFVALARAVLRLGLRGEDREFLRGDLDEELERRRSHGAFRHSAARWYLSQAVRAVLARAVSRGLHERAIRGRWALDRRGDGMVWALLQDLRYSMRVLRKQPMMVATVVLTLAVGVGVTVTMFTFVNGMLFRPLPFRAAHEIVALEEVASDGNRMRVNSQNYADWRDRSSSFAATAIYATTSFNVSSGAEPIRVSAALASGQFFEVLGVEPARGRVFGPADDVAGQPDVAVLSHGVWQRAFGGDPAIVGSEIRLHGRPYEVIGIMGSGFVFPEFEDVWVPARIDPALSDRASHSWSVIARLATDVTVAAARAELTAISERLAAEHPETNQRLGATATTLRAFLVGDSGTPAGIFLGVVVFVLLIATVNVGNLMLARASTRTGEIAIRSALGASRGRLVRQLMVESLLMSSAGATLGLIGGGFGRDLVIGAVPVEVPRWMDFGIDVRVIAFGGLLAVLTGVVFGLVPSLFASSDLSGTIKRGATTAARRNRLRTLLVVAEVALALVLLVGAGLMMKGVTQLGRVDPGIDAHGVFTARVSLPAAEYSDARSAHDFLARLQTEVASLPGVRAVGFVNFLPLTNSGSTTWVSREDLVLAEGERPPTAMYYVVQGNYFEALGVTITRGRAFDAVDVDREAPRVVMVSERLATLLWPEEDPIGRRIKLGRPDDETAWRTVVGVTADVLHWGLDATAWPSLYLPGEQARSLSNSLVARVDGDPSGYAAALRTRLHALDANLPAYEFSDMASLVERSTWQPVLYSWMFGVFAAMAMSLAAIGLYGVVAFSVGQRTREMGIRVALGAPRHGVMLLVVRQSMVVVWIGIAAGLAGSFALSGVLSNIVFGVNTTDLGVYASVAGLLSGVALCATLFPSRRATRIDPMGALRAD